MVKRKVITIITIMIKIITITLEATIEQVINIVCLCFYSVETRICFKRRKRKRKQQRQ